MSQVTANDLMNINLRVEKDSTNNTYIVYYKENIINGFETEEDAFFSVNQLIDFFTIGYINGSCSQANDIDGTKTILDQLGVDYSQFFVSENEKKKD